MNPRPRPSGLASRRLRTLIVAVAAGSVVSACALAGRGPRPQLYRFGAEPAAEASAAASTRTLTLSTLAFQTGAAGDRLLAVEGAQVFYVAGARWLSRAEELFTQAAERAFSNAGLRLARRGQPFTPDASLVMAVPVFETRYLNGLEAAPTVVVEVRASVLSGADRSLVGERTFSASQPASGNTVGQIVAAYDAATRQVLGEAAAWAASTTPAAART